uniref:Uncharacterized protein n=1 Tax=Cacopsylla melanoneura TaxID=428564 RepID=A0A8D8TY46_9HEMI
MLATIDRSDALYHVPVERLHRRFLAFRYQGITYNWTCLPFGLASAPQAFSQLTNWVAAFLRSWSVRIIVYLVSKQPAPCNPNTTGSSEGSGLVSSTLGRWTDPSISSTLSSDPVILKTLKGIQALRPRQEGRRIRDVHQLRLWISWNPPSLSSFFEISPACCYLTPRSLGS